MAKVPRKKTIRRLPPKTREFAKALKEAQLALNRLEKQLPVMSALELDSRALANVRASVAVDTSRPGKPAGPGIFEAMDAAPEEPADGGAPPETNPES